MTKEMVVEKVLNFMLLLRKIGCAHSWTFKERLVLCGHVMARHECVKCGKSRYLSYDSNIYSND